MDLNVGDLLQARVQMRAWESFDRRGDHGKWIRPGSTAMLLDTWRTESWTRLVVLLDGQTTLFSCRTHVLSRNWNIVRTGPVAPTSQAR